jgi:arylformamidase
MNTFIDISLPLHHQTITWPGDPPVHILPQYHPDNSIVSQLQLGIHSGTHIDAPRHFLPQGKTIDQIPLEKLNGPCQVINIKSASPEITLNDFKPQTIIPGSRILFKTKNSRLYDFKKFNQHYISLSMEVARFLADRHIWLVGIDYLSIEPYNILGHPIHKILLTKEIVILESLYLDHVVQGNYQLTCLPISLYQTEAAPCRAILTKNQTI